MSHAPGTTLKPLVKLGKKPGDCWSWLGATDAAGYGRKEFHGRTWLAHRWVWSQLFGPVPRGMVVTHDCQNPGCVNPHHLRVVTQAENCRAGLTAVLTEGDVREIRHLDECGWYADNIAAKFGVSVSTVKSLLRGQSWRRARPFYGPKKYAPKKEVA